MKIVIFNSEWLKGFEGLPNWVYIISIIWLIFFILFMSKFFPIGKVGE